MTEIKRLMPDRIYLGDFMQSTMLLPIDNWRNDEAPNLNGYRKVMGFFLPKWQRGLVWTREQQVRFLESAWLGLNLGTFTFNRSKVHGGPLDNLLIDGQQRLYSLECYLNDGFSVFGHFWSEVTKTDKRLFEMTRHFGCYITKSEDEKFLREYYNLMNFGGTAHRESERA